LLRAIGAAHGVDAAAVALAWLLAKPGVIPIPGAKTGSQATGNAAALRVTLGDDEIDRLDTATERWRV
jgi:aryl-alcohol dehydrogenase-like predicted oxidoreductase